MFDSIGNQPVMPSEIRPPGNREVEEIREGANGTTKRQVAIPSLSFAGIIKAHGILKKPEDPPVQEGQTCLGCSATSTPEWRRGPMGERFAFAVHTG